MTKEQTQKAWRIFHDQFDLPRHKILWVIATYDHLCGAVGVLFTRYGFERDADLWDLFYMFLCEKLEGGDVEPEWSDREWENLTKLKEIFAPRITA